VAFPVVSIVLSSHGVVVSCTLVKPPVDNGVAAGLIGGMKSFREPKLFCWPLSLDIRWRFSSNRFNIKGMSSLHDESSDHLEDAAVGNWAHASQRRGPTWPGPPYPDLGFNKVASLAGWVLDHHLVRNPLEATIIRARSAFAARLGDERGLALSATMSMKVKTVSSTIELSG